MKFYYIKKLVLFLTLCSLVFSCAKKIEPDSDLGHYKAAGDEYFAAGDYELALEAYMNALERAENPILASEVQLAIANVYYADKEYLLAIGVYEIYLDLYPNSPSTIDAYLDLGLAHYEIRESPNRDLTDAVKSIKYFNLVKQFDLEIFNENNLAEKIVELREELAAKEYKIARYYSRILEREPAILRYQYILDNYLDTMIAEKSFYRMIVLMLKDNQLDNASMYIDKFKDKFSKDGYFSDAEKKYDKALRKFNKKEKG